MPQNVIVTVLIFLFSGVFGLVVGQTPTTVIKPSYVSGAVVTISDGKIVVDTPSGHVAVSLTDKTEFKRVPAENPSLKAATAATLADIGVGDKLTVTGILAADGKSMPARSVYLMSQSEIAQKKAREAAEWRTRGIAGKVTSVNPQTTQITVDVRGSSVTLTPKDKATFLRYAPDSVKFDEAKASSPADVKPGDMLRALGDRSADGTSFSAEKVVTGAFQTVFGTVKSVDALKNEVVITDFQTKKEITVVVVDTSVLKMFPPDMAERMAGVQMAGAAGARPAGQGAQAPAGNTAAQTPGGQTPGARPGMGGQRPGGGLDDMLDRFPDLKLADLKVGDAIALSSTKNGNSDRIKAFKLVAGIEAFLKMAMAQAAASGAGRGGQGVQINIPGLDSIGTP